jgi:hypothetical protein
VPGLAPGALTLNDPLTGVLPVNAPLMDTPELVAALNDGVNTPLSEETWTCGFCPGAQALFGSLYVTPITHFLESTVADSTGVAPVAELIVKKIPGGTFGFGATNNCWPAGDA